MNPQKAQARWAGLLYLGVGVFGGFSQGYVQPKLYVAGDAAATAATLAANADLLRWGVLADLTQATLFLFLALKLYHLFRPTRESRALAMLALVAIATGIMSLNNTFEYVALRLVGEPSTALLLLELQHYGALTAQVFFGLWLVPLGLLGWESKLFPRWLGALLVAGGVCYLVNVATVLVVPEFGEALKGGIILVPGVAEIATVLYLLIVGVRTKTA